MGDIGRGSGERERQGESIEIIKISRVIGRVEQSRTGYIGEERGNGKYNMDTQEMG